MAIRNQATQEMDQEVNGATMARMFDLRNVFELVDDGFRDGSFAQEEFVHQRDRSIFHIGFLQTAREVESMNEILVQLPKQWVRK